MKKIIIILIAYFLASQLFAMSANPRYFTPSEKFHIVKQGDTISSISTKHNVPERKLLLFKHMKSEKIYLGQKIYLIPKPIQWHQYITIRNIPQKGYHIVRPKETIYTISQMYDLEIIDLIDINKLSSLKLKTGKKIYLIKNIEDSSEFVAKIDIIDVEKEIISKKKKAPPLEKIEIGRVFLPVSGIVTSEFGIRDGRPHKGIDIAAKKGTPILSALAGKVVFAGRQRGYGNVVILEHSNNIMTVYAHNEANLVRVDEAVKQGQPIATLGSTGVSTGPHLHFEYRKNGRAINPRDVLPEIK